MQHHLQSISERYSQIFGLGDFRESSRLRCFAYVMLFGLSGLLSNWSRSEFAFLNGSSSTSISCWAYFKDCAKLHFLTIAPEGNSYNLFFILLSVLVGYSGLSMIRGRYVAFHISAAFLVLVEFFFLFIWSNDYISNYQYYHVVLFFFLIFVTPRLEFLRIVFVLLYFFAGQVKFDDGWVLGSYFTSLKGGMLYVPGLMVPFFSFAVIALEVVGAWFLLSNNLFRRYVVLALFVLFHLYSSLYVGFRYPLTVVPPLFVLFASSATFDFSASKIIRGRIGLIALFCGLLIQLMGDFIKGNEKMTLEGYSYGLFMFDANHQCRSEVRVYRADNTSEGVVEELPLSRGRCDPYRRWEKIKRICAHDPSVIRVGWTFDHSINGGPFYRIVDVPNGCNLDYHPFRHNNWIWGPEDGAPVVGYPVRNCLGCVKDNYVRRTL